MVVLSSSTEGHTFRNQGQLGASVRIASSRVHPVSMQRSSVWAWRMHASYIRLSSRVWARRTPRSSVWAWSMQALESKRWVCEEQVRAWGMQVNPFKRGDTCTCSSSTAVHTWNLHVYTKRTTQVWCEESHVRGIFLRYKMWCEKSYIEQ